MNSQSTQTVWDFLSNIPIGTIVAWVIVICAIIGFLCGLAVKLYKVFSKYREVKDENEKFKQASKTHDEKIDKLSEKLDKVYSEIEMQKQMNYKQIRHSIVRACDEAIRTKRISPSKYKSLMEMYDEYVIVFADMKPNGYVHKLVDRVSDPNEVTIIGKLDE